MLTTCIEPCHIIDIKDGESVTEKFLSTSFEFRLIGSLGRVKFVDEPGEKVKEYGQDTVQRLKTVHFYHQVIQTRRLQ